MGAREGVVGGEDEVEDCREEGFEYVVVYWGGVDALEDTVDHGEEGCLFADDGSILI